MMRASMIRSGMSCASSSSPELLSSSLLVLVLPAMIGAEQSSISALVATTLLRGTAT